MKEVILIKIGEIVLKGLNRRNFEDRLIKTIKRRTSLAGEFHVVNAQSTIYLIPKEGAEADLDMAADKVSKIFGISRFTRAGSCDKDIGEIKKLAEKYLYDELSTAKTFKVETKRSDKSFSLKSPEISAEIGGHILKKFPNIKVDVHNPDVVVNIEVRDFGAYVYGTAKAGAGGIPVGTGGKAAILISGGIDSPVAAWSMAKRGMELVGIHFASPPYTSERARQKVVELLRKVSEYAGRIEMVTVPFTEIQEKIKSECREEFFTVIMRRFMMKISERIASLHGAKALITGESLGQVASQTIDAICCTDNAANMPIFRPLIGMDKDEIVYIARKIDTFETSILPYEDCCTVFTPKHPKTKPTVSEIEREESKLDVETLINNSISEIDTMVIYPEN